MSGRNAAGNLPYEFSVPLVRADDERVNPEVMDERRA
jgi:hypothetical protein